MGTWIFLYPSLLLSWMFEHACFDTCCFGCLICMCCIFLYLHLFSANWACFTWKSALEIQLLLLLFYYQVWTKLKRKCPMHADVQGVFAFSLMQSIKQQLFPLVWQTHIYITRSKFIPVEDCKHDDSLQPGPGRHTTRWRTATPWTTTPTPATSDLPAASRLHHHHLPTNLRRLPKWQSSRTLTLWQTCEDTNLWQTWP